MYKKDLSAIRKYFKQDSERLNVSQIYNVYCKMDSKKILFEKKEIFSVLEENVQEMYLKNFKKILTGAIDNKIFELEFNKDVVDEYQSDFIELVEDNLKQENVDKVVKNILDNCNYDTDVIISFINCELKIPTKNKKDKEDEEADEIDSSYKFIICTVSKIQMVNPDLSLDVAKKKIELNSDMDTLIIKNPVEGFVFPVFSEGYIDVNKVLYNSPKSNVLNNSFVESVIGCTKPLTAESEKEIFKKILNTSLGETIKSEILYDVYSDIMTINAETPESISETVSVKDISKILESKGVDNLECIQDFLEKANIKNPNFDFKVENIVPQKSKSIRFKNNNIDISLSANELGQIKQVNKNGKKCLIIELSEDVEIEGFKLETEKL